MKHERTLNLFIRLVTALCIILAVVLVASACEHVDKTDDTSSVASETSDASADASTDASETSENSADSSSDASETEKSDDSSAESASEEEISIDYEAMNMSDYISLGQYLNLEAKTSSVEITDTDVELEVEDMLYEYVSFEEITDRGVEMGDILEITFKGSLDGVEREEICADGYSYTVGVTNFIDGFEAGLMGMKVGETKQLNLKFPEDYGDEEFNGKDAVFTVTIDSITAEIYPELTSDLVSEVTDGAFTDVDAFLKNIKDELYAEAVKKAESDRRVNVWYKALDNATVIEWPADVKAAIDKVVKEYFDYYKFYADSYGMTLEDFTGYTEDELDDYFRTEAETQYKATMVMYAIMKAESISSEVTDDEFTSAAEKYAEDYGYDSVDKMVEDYGKESIVEAIVWDRVIDYIYATAVEAE